MEVDRKSRLSKDEAYSLIEQYYQSGELPSVFYRRVGLSDKQFYAWRQRYLRDHPSLAKKLGISLTGKTPRNASYKLPLDPPHSASASAALAPSGGFARVEVSGSSSHQTATTASPRYELCYPNGVVLRLPIGISISSLSELIRLY